MSKLVDNERLARLAKALDDRAKAAVAAEQERALAAEALINALAEQNEAAIAEINGEEGLLAQANKAIADEQERAESAEQGLSDRIDTLDAKFGEAADDFFNDLKGDESTTIGGMVADIAENKAKLAGIADEDGAVKEGAVKAYVDAAVAGEKERAEEQEGKLANKIAALELKVNGGEGEGQDSIDDKIAAAQVAAEAKAAELDATLKTELEDEIELKVAQSEYDTKIANFESRIAANETFVAAQPAVDKAQDDRIKALEDDAPVKQAAIEAAQEAAENAQADVDAVVQRLDAENGIAARITANEGALAVLNGEEEGSVAKAVADAIAKEVEDRNDAIADESALRVAEEQRIEGLVTAEAERAAGKEGELDAAIKAEAERAGKVEEEIRGEFADADATLHTVISKEIDDDVKAEAERAVAKEGELQAAIEKEVEDREAAIEDVQGEIDALEVVVGKAKAGEEAATGLFLAVEQGDAKALEDAKKYADEQITALVDSAPDAMNTLNELAAAIGAHQDVYDDYVATVSTDLAKKVDKVEGSRLVAETEIAAFNAKAEVSQVEQALQDAKDFAQAEDAKLQKAIDDCEAKDVEQDGRLADLEALMGIGGEDQQGSALDSIRGDIEALEQKDEELQGEIDAAEGRILALENANKEEGAVGSKLAELDEAVKAAQADATQALSDAADEKLRAEGEEAAIRGEMATEANRVNQKIANDIAAAVGAYAAEGVEASGLRKEIAEKDAAVRTDFAAADEALHAAIKGEMAAVIQSLVAEITEDGMLRIALGGIQGDDVLVIREQEIPFATDEEIDQIIAGLDETATE